MAWDSTKPIAGTGMTTAEIRQQWIAIERSALSLNLVADPTFLIWPGGDTVEPAHWSVTGTGVTIDRETVVRKYGAMEEEGGRPPSSWRELLRPWEA